MQLTSNDLKEEKEETLTL